MAVQTVNPDLLGLARDNVTRFAKVTEKRAFVLGGDPAMAADPMAGGGAPPPGGDPMAGGAPPPGGDPMAGGAPPPGGDPMAGGAPPPGGDPMAGGAPPPGGDPMAAIMPMIQQAVQQAMMQQGGGGGMGVAPGEAAIKPKIDINVEIMQVKKLLAKLCDAMGVQIPAADMVATPDDLNQMAQGGPGMAAATPDGGGMGGGPSAIKPIDPMGAAMPAEKPASDRAGQAFDNPFGKVANKAQAILAIQNRRRSA